MKPLAYKKIDAFTSGASLGNPAACIFLKQGEELTQAEMLDIAKRHKGFVSEVVYCSPLPHDEYALTYYSSECEVDFCGHGTIACMYSLFAETPALRERAELSIHTRAKGRLRVFNDLAARDAVFIAAPLPQCIGSEIPVEAIAERLSLRPGQLAAERPIESIDAGLKTLIIPVATLRDEIAVFPGEQPLKAFCLEHGIDIVLLYSLETASPANIAHTRVFAPKFGYLEDPATGSGNSAFGYYMLKNSLWDGTPATIEQGGEDRVFNSVSLSFREDRVLFGGRATTRISGEYYLSIDAQVMEL